MRSVQCVSHEAAGPRVVEDAVCAAYSQAPPTLQTCNMQRCAEYRAGAWSQVGGPLIHNRLLNGVQRVIWAELTAVSCRACSAP